MWPPRLLGLYYSRDNGKIVKYTQNVDTRKVWDAIERQMSSAQAQHQGRSPSLEPYLSKLASRSIQITNPLA